MDKEKLSGVFAPVVTPFDNDDIGYYTEVADNVPVPVLLYNAPGFAGGVQISPSAIKKLSSHPNIVGMKDSSPSGWFRKIYVRVPPIQKSLHFRTVVVDK